MNRMEKEMVPFLCFYQRTSKRLRTWGQGQQARRGSCVARLNTKANEEAHGSERFGANESRKADPKGADA